jgi:D-alanyl-D-alanine carboxypeptidase
MERMTIFFIVFFLTAVWFLLGRTPSSQLPAASKISSGEVIRNIGEKKNIGYVAPRSLLPFDEYPVKLVGKIPLLQPQEPPPAPIFKENAAPLLLEAGGAEALFLQNEGRTFLLFEKESMRRFSIASITKLMTALVAAQHFPPEEIITISHRAAGSGEQGFFGEGQKIPLRDLLGLLLVGSRNDAASAIADAAGRDFFLGEMNRKAQEIGLRDTFFVNPTGLDPFPAGGIMNYSTADDLGRFAVYLLRQHKDIFETTLLPEYRFSGEGRGLAVSNTNEFLFEEGLPFTVAGGKTGETRSAKKNLLLIARTPGIDGFLIGVVLYAEDRVREMKKLLTWVLESYEWKLPERGARRFGG